LTAQVFATEDDEVQEFEERDETSHADELSSIGLLAQLVPAHVLPMLSTLLGQRLTALVQPVALVVRGTQIEGGGD
jgi:hypothetical protein